MSRLTRALQASAGFAFCSTPDVLAPRCLSAVVDMGSVTRMRKMILPILGFMIVAAFAAFALSPWLYNPVHDFIGRQNTIYSSLFTNDRWAHVLPGTPREKVINLLGAPFDQYTYTLDTNYPPWAEGIESLSFSRPKWSGDYESIIVYIGHDQRLKWCTRGVTD